MPVQGADPDPGPPGYLVEGCVVGPVLGERRQGSLDQPLAVAPRTNGAKPGNEFTWARPAVSDWR